MSHDTVQDIMSQITNIIKNFAVVREDACTSGTGAAAIAAAPVPLFQMVQRPAPSKPKRKKRKTLREAVGLTEMNHSSTTPTTPTDSTNDADRIISHLKRSEKEATHTPDNTEVFGLEGDDGQIITVSVDGQDAEGFKSYLQTALAHMDDGDIDIGELLYNARNMFNIVDINWPEIEENEESQVGLNLDDGNGQPTEDAPPDDFDLPPDDASADDESSSVLLKVIDMMRTDAEARKAEAEARALEAKHKEAKLIVQQASDRVKHEEELLDMETWEKANKERDKETKQLARLAKWKHAVSSGDAMGKDVDSINDATQENEEMGKEPTQLIPSAKRAALNKRVTTKELSDFVFSRMAK